MDSPDPVSRLNATLKGRYRLRSELGQGGMATVYLADDLKHDREVALKVLKAQVAAVVGAERFLAEIRTTAKLRHPHILPLFDSGDADGCLYYVMPWVSGESLRQRLDRERQLPVDDAVRIAEDVAEALDYAHRQGVIHRDIKPANILLQDGKPVVSDFGIALAVRAGGGDRLTETGLSVGTPHYMSPEQVTGDASVGAATDIYALGCVLHEMLVGEPPHTGNTAQAILGKVLFGYAGRLTDHRKSVPPHVEETVSCALERIPADRFASAGAMAAALRNPDFRLRTVRADWAPRRARGRFTWPRLAVGGALLSLALGVALGRGIASRGDEPRSPTRYRLGFEQGQEPLQSFGRSIAQSPDGARIVYLGPPEDEPQLWIRDRSQLASRPVPGTAGALQPFFSPDGAAVGFVSADGALKVVPPGGTGTLTLVASGVLPYGAAWAEDGYVYFDRSDRVGLARVASRGGGAPETVSEDTLPPEVRGHGWPVPLPGGLGVIHTIVRNHVDDLIAVLDLRTGEDRVLLPGTVAQYAEPGQLVYVERDGSLLAAPFDERRMVVTGPGVLLDELGAGVGEDVTLAGNGRLVYAGTPAPIYEVVWVDRDGTETPLDALHPLRGIRFLALSPDESRLAVNTWPARPRDDGQVWIKDLPDGAYERFTFEGDVNFRPEWTHDGRALTFVSDRLGSRDVWIKSIDGGAEARLLFDDDVAIDEAALYEGGVLLYRRGMQDGERDLYVFRPGIDSAGRPLVRTPFDEAAPALSPDGRWLAYAALVDGQSNVYVRPFPDADRQWRVSTNGGYSPVWSDGGRELLYISEADSMMSRPLLPGEGFELGAESALFSTYPYAWDFFHQAFDVTADGRRFVMVRLGEADRVFEDLIVVEDWTADARRRMESH